MLAALLNGLLLGFPAAAQPGPFQAYLLARTLRAGWRRTLPAALAPLLSDGPIVLLVLLLLTQLSPALLLALRGAGALFLLWLAWGTGRSLRRGAQHVAAAPAAGSQSLMEAALMNLLNPNPYLFWSVVGGPTLLAAARASPGQGLAFLLGFYGTLVGGNVLLIALFGAAGRLNPRMSWALSAASALALALFGAWQLWALLRLLGAAR